MLPLRSKPSDRVPIEGEREVVPMGPDRGRAASRVGDTTLLERGPKLSRLFRRARQVADVERYALRANPREGVSRPFGEAARRLRAREVNRQAVTDHQFLPLRSVPGLGTPSVQGFLPLAERPGV